MTFDIYDKLYEILPQRLVNRIADVEINFIDEKYTFEKINNDFYFRDINKYQDKKVSSFIMEMFFDKYSYTDDEIKNFINNMNEYKTPYYIDFFISKTDNNGWLSEINDYKKYVLVHFDENEEIKLHLFNSSNPKKYLCNNFSQIKEIMDLQKLYNSI